MQTEPQPADYIQPLYINGLNGRMLHVPAKGNRKREILVLYGHHALLERWWGLIQSFNDYGAVTMPDIPGFGGMDSFYKIGQKATLDNYADYLAAFIKMRYKRRRVSIVGISFGFLIVTRMFQRYPELTARVDLLVSAAGFMRRDDFIFSRQRYLFYRCVSLLFSNRVGATIFRYTALNAVVLRFAYSRTNNAKHKFAPVVNDKERFRQMMDMEIVLWQKNDVRTYMKTTIELLTVDNCQVPVDLPVWHVYTKHDHFFDHTIVEQHMRVVFRKFHGAPIKLRSHTVGVLASKEEAGTLIPPALRRALTRATKNLTHFP